MKNDMESDWAGELMVMEAKHVADVVAVHMLSFSGFFPHLPWPKVPELTLQ